MIQQKLVELYFEKAPSSSYSYVEIEEEIVWLLNKGVKPEELYFYIQYLSRYYPVELAHEFAESDCFKGGHPQEQLRFSQSSSIA